MSAGNETAPNASPPLRRVEVRATGYYLAEPGRRSPAPTLIGLHGYGQTAEDFLRVARRTAGEDFAVAAGQGFNQIWDPATKKISFTWLTSYERDDSVLRNNLYLDATIDALVAEGMADPGAIFLLGFSQGSSVAYRYARDRPGKIRGVVSSCADLPPDVERNLPALAGTAVLVAYGLRDPVFPEAKPQHAAAALRAGGIDVEIVSFDKGHVVPSSLGPKFRDWSARVLEESRAAGRYAAGVRS